MRKKPAIHASRLIYSGYVDLIEDDLETKTGDTITFNVIKTKRPAVAILAETVENTLLVTTEYRHGIAENVMSVPGGNIDGDEDPITAGKRELLEETGFEATHWKELGTFFPCPALLDQKVHLLLAGEAERTAFPRLEPAEWIESNLMTYDDLCKKIKTGIPTDSVLLALLHYYSQ